jgi:hypothetical protein
MANTGDRQDQTSFFVADAIVSRANGRHAYAPSKPAPRPM